MRPRGNTFPYDTRMILCSNLIQIRTIKLCQTRNHNSFITQFLVNAFPFFLELLYAHTKKFTEIFVTYHPYSLKTIAYNVFKFIFLCFVYATRVIVLLGKVALLFIYTSRAATRNDIFPHIHIYNIGYYYVIQLAFTGGKIRYVKLR